MNKYKITKMNNKLAVIDSKSSVVQEVSEK